MAVRRKTADQLEREAQQAALARARTGGNAPVAGVTYGGMGGPTTVARGVAPRPAVTSRTGSADTMERQQQRRIQQVRRAGGTADAMERRITAVQQRVPEAQASRIIASRVNQQRASQGLAPVAGMPASPQQRITPWQQPPQPVAQPVAAQPAPAPAQPAAQQPATPAFSWTQGGTYTPPAETQTPESMALSTMAMPSVAPATGTGAGTGMRLRQSSTGRAEVKASSPMINRPSAARESTSLLSQSRRSYDPTQAYGNLRY